MTDRVWSRKTWRIGALGVVLLAGFAWLTAHLVGVRPVQREAVSIRIAQSLEESASEKLRKALEPYCAEHPEVQIAVVYRPAEAGATEWGALPVHLVLRPAATGELLPSGPGLPALFADYVLLAFHKRLVSDAPRTWAELVRAAQRARETEAVRYGLGLSMGGDGVVPFLSPAFWPSIKTDASKIAEEAWSLLHELNFGSGLVPPACTMDCVVHEMSRGRLPFAIVDEGRVAHLRTALGEELGLSALPPLPVSAMPLRSVRRVFGVFALPVASPLEAAVARDIVAYLRQGQVARIAKALGKAAAAHGLTDELSQIVSAHTVDADPSEADRARRLTQTLWDRFRNGQVSASLAAREAVAQWTAAVPVRNE